MSILRKYFLAVDIGASGGRHIVGWLEEGKIHTKEVYRFENYFENKKGHLCWDTKRIFKEIKEGMVRCRQLGMLPVSVGIDTWAVDYVLLGKSNKMLSEAIAYRDKRTEGMDKRVFEKVSESDLYKRTGIQKQDFNTIYQLMADMNSEMNILKKAEDMLMLPDYFHYLLTGVKAAEYTNATTTQLVYAEDSRWDYELIQRLGFPKKIFKPLIEPGTVLGRLQKEIAEEIGYSCNVCVPGTHDTASAVFAVPSKDKDVLYISSGTWSLMGTVLESTNCSEKSRRANFTNEGGCGHTVRFLKNIMGLWMIQSLRHELNDKYDYATFCEMAEKETISSIVNCNDKIFISPESMMEAIKNQCVLTGQSVPESPGQYARIVYRSLAYCYKNTAEEIEKLTGKVYKEIYIVGGGANASYLNRLTAKITGKTVIAGPSEATAMGNLMVQMISNHCFENRGEAIAAEKKGLKLEIFRP